MNLDRIPASLLVGNQLFCSHSDPLPFIGIILPPDVTLYRLLVDGEDDAMMGRPDKGIILTTGTFTLEAKKEARRDGVPPIEWQVTTVGLGSKVH